MNKLIFILLALIFLNNCSLNENSRLWQNKDNSIENKKNVQKVFAENKKIVSEFNKDLQLNLSLLDINSKNIENKNNFGSQKYSGKFDKIGSYKFSKLEKISNLNFKPIFFDDGVIFFDKKGSIIRFDKNQKIVWKKNHYSKLEKKMQPKLNFLLDDKNLLVVDNIAKYYSVNLDSGELNWSKNNTYPFNSEIKKYKDKIFAIDYKNTLRCYEILDGSECWNLQTEDSFTISNTKYSLIILNNNVVFSNSIGDITAVDIETGYIAWQLPTQSSNIVNETYNFKISQLVSDDNSIFFSNNKNQFFSIDVKTGTTNWINEINSDITPKIIGNLIFTISNEGYLYVVEKNTGNILRISDIFINYKNKKRKNIYPIGFVIGGKNLYVTNSDGKMIIVDVGTGKTTKIEKVSGSFVSKPFIFNENLFLVRNGSIVQYN